jgi:hypothetical protein
MSEKLPHFDGSPYITTTLRCVFRNASGGPQVSEIRIHDPQIPKPHEIQQYLPRFTAVIPGSFHSAITNEEVNCLFNKSIDEKKPTCYSHGISVGD